MREEERRLFPLSTIGSVVQLFRLQLSGSEEPDIALLSIVSGCVENSLTSPRIGGVAEVSVSRCGRVVGSIAECHVGCKHRGRENRVFRGA